jgi:acetyl-CoA carboxylase biotin carboxylase subunit
MIRRVLIANRGEIAGRILRTCGRLGIESVLAASEADLDSVPARLADRVVCIGPAPAARSYLNVDAILAAARAERVDAIHPGYGFLAENAALAKACAEAHLIFIGATEAQLLAVGDKWQAREIAQRAGIPVIPGLNVHTAEEAERAIADIGLPLLVKAVGGGGGRGMKRITDPAQAAHAVAVAMAEADAAFGDARVYLERLVQHGRHVEVQVLGDGTRVIHLGTRDCSVQRRYQKLTEEAPAPLLSDGLREQLHSAAVAYARSIAYRGLGTVEFLVDSERNEFYFLEMNARIQVEHPVTEAITGLDLVEEQIAVAEGWPLRLAQEDVHFNGHAIELRINAEDPAQDFRPCPGTITRAVFPVGCGIRVDTHIEAGANVPPFYDSLLAKVIVHGGQRSETLAHARAALASLDIRGVATNRDMHREILIDETFCAGGVTTDWFAARRALEVAA